MNDKRLAGIIILILIAVMGCFGNFGKLKTQSESESKVTQQELIDKWAEYNVYFTRSYYETSGDPFKATLIAFDPKNSDRKIMFGNDWSGVKDQETCTEIVKANVTSQGNFAVGPEGWTHYPVTRVTEIRGPDNQLYGFIIRPKDVGMAAYLVDENTLRLSWSVTGGGSPAK